MLHLRTQTCYNYRTNKQDILEINSEDSNRSPYITYPHWTLSLCCSIINNPLQAIKTAQSFHTIILEQSRKFNIAQISACTLPSLNYTQLEGTQGWKDTEKSLQRVSRGHLSTLWTRNILVCVQRVQTAWENVLVNFQKIWKSKWFQADDGNYCFHSSLLGTLRFHTNLLLGGGNAEEERER